MCSNFENENNIPTSTDFAKENTQDNITERRRSSRIHKQPIHLKDYYCNQVQDHWCGLVKYTNKSKPCLHIHHEPKMYKQAINNPKWKEAMNTEIKALEKKNWGTCTFTQRKKGHRE